MIRTRVWNTLCNLQFKTYLLALLIRKYQKLDRNINIFLAIASSTSIAAWAIWNAVPLIWGGIIALSQVVTVIKPYLPYYKYVKELNIKWVVAENMNLEIERVWNDLQVKKIEEDAADTFNYDIKKRMIDVFNFSDETIFTVTKTFENEANEQMKNFLRTHYQIDIVTTTTKK